MFKKRDKSKERDPNLLREVAEQVSDLSSQINNLEITNENQESSDNPVSDTPRYRKRSLSPSSVHNIASRNGSRERQAINDDLINIQELLRNLKKDPNFQSTLTDGLGRILIEIQCQLNEVNKKIGLPCIKDTDDICMDYTEYLMDFKNNIDRKLNTNYENVDSDLENKIELAVRKLNKEKLSKINHNAAETIFPPTSFSPVDIMKGNEHKISQVQTYFPFKNKFKGAGYEPAITQWLDNLNDGQEICNISEKEFINVMRKCTTGTAYEEICAMIESKLGINQIYQALLNKYDTRRRPETAKQMLESYIPPTNATLKSIQGDIMALALRSKLLYAKASQTMAYNHDTVKALIKALPEVNHADAYRVLDELNAYYDGYPEFADFCTALSRYEISINNNLKKRGNLRANFNRQPHTYAYSAPKKIIKSNYNKIKAIGAHLRNTNKQREYPPLVIYENHVDRLNNYKNNNYNKAKPNYNFRQNNNHTPNKNYKSTNGYNKTNYNQKTNSYKKYPQNPNKMELGIRGRHACTLCGSNNHQASSGCFKMRNDYGRLVFCPPSQEPCSRCLRENNKTLYHPEVLCFNRPKMKQLLSEGKFKFPTSEERQQLKNFIERGGKTR